METVEKRINLSGVDMATLFGTRDVNLLAVENKFDASIVARGDSIIVRGEPNEVNMIDRIFRELAAIVNKSSSLSPRDVETVIDALATGKEVSIREEDLASVLLYTKTGVIKARTPGQSEYYKIARTNDIVFAIGPAGTGKTYLAVAMAVAALRNREITRVVLCRPAVEAGESLGFLPGDLREKIDPYLRPLYDALEEMLSTEKLKSFIEKNVIEIAPLAYMRGRTLNNAFVILDEEQNATAAQMKMFLTRLGMNSRAIVTGDVTQIDLPFSATSGLVEVEKILRGIEGIAFAYFTEQDVVRHRLVKDIIDAYGKHDAARREQLGGNINKNVSEVTGVSLGTK
jgi:phosphate starvation-inducible PhoH-like protein